jgi:hypothetical protein
VSTHYALFAEIKFLCFIRCLLFKDKFFLVFYSNSTTYKNMKTLNYGQKVHIVYLPLVRGVQALSFPFCTVDINTVSCPRGSLFKVYNHIEVHNLPTETPKYSSKYIFVYLNQFKWGFHNKPFNVEKCYKDTGHSFCKCSHPKNRLQEVAP